VGHLCDRVAIIGASGQLGTDLMDVFRDREPIGLSHAGFDLEDAASLTAGLERYRPTLVINTAAYHNVEQCEEHPERAFAVNALGVDRLAGLCARYDCAFATFGTDYVFDGSATQPYQESDLPNPLNAYGTSKLAGEFLTKRHSGRHFLFRTSGLFGRAGSSSKGYTFVDRILRQAQAGEPLRVVTDMTFSPSYTRHVARIVRSVIERGAFGLYHVTNSGACTWFEFASEALRLRGFDAAIEPITTAQFAARVKRPRYSALAHTALLRAGFPEPPPWRQGLSEYLAERS